MNSYLLRLKSALISIGLFFAAQFAWSATFAYIMSNDNGGSVNVCDLDAATTALKNCRPTGSAGDLGPDGTPFTGFRKPTDISFFNNKAFIPNAGAYPDPLNVKETAHFISVCERSDQGELSHCSQSPVPVAIYNLSDFKKDANGQYFAFGINTEQNAKDAHIFICYLIDEGKDITCNAEPLIANFALNKPTDFAFYTFDNPEMPNGKDPFIYVTNAGDNTVSYCRLSSFGFITSCSYTEAIFNAPSGIAFNQGYVYITNAADKGTDSNSVMFCRALTNEGTHSFLGCNATGTGFVKPSSIAFHQNMAYITNQDKINANEDNLGQGNVSFCETKLKTGALINCARTGGTFKEPSGLTFCAVNALTHACRENEDD